MRPTFEQFHSTEKVLPLSRVWELRELGFTILIRAKGNVFIHPNREALMDIKEEADLAYDMKSSEIEICSGVFSFRVHK